MNAWYATHEAGLLPWDIVARRLAEGALAILPVGAGAKQHGWHLPMKTDAIQAGYLAEQICERIPALFWPVLPYGYYPAFVDYAGSCSLSADLFERLIGELVAALLGYGARGVLVVDTGISTIGPIDRAIAGTVAPHRVLHLKVYDGPRYRETGARLATQVHGSHADELETSCLLTLAPSLVAMDRATAGPTRPPGRGPMQHGSHDAPNYSASGSIGDPTAASSAKGDVLLAAIVGDLIDAVHAWSDQTDFL